MREEELYRKAKLRNISYSIPLNLNLMTFENLLQLTKRKQSSDWGRPSSARTGKLPGSGGGGVGDRTATTRMMVFWMRVSENYMWGETGKK